MVTIVLLSSLLVGCYTDIRHRIIPNYLTFGLMIAGLVYNIWAGPGWFFSLAGIAAGFVLFLLPYLFTGMGAGDVKLLMGVGAFVGFQNIIIIGMLSGVLAAVYSLGIFLGIFYREKRINELINCTKGHAIYILAKSQINDFSRELIEGKTIPYAVPVTISYVCLLVWRWLPSVL